MELGNERARARAIRMILTPMNSERGNSGSFVRYAASCARAIIVARSIARLARNSGRWDTPSLSFPIPPFPQGKVLYSWMDPRGAENSHLIR